MSGVRPRRLVHRGAVEASGFVLDLRVLGAREARARIVSRWSPGARVFRLDQDALILLPARPERVVAERAIGAPLVRTGSCLSSAPLTAGELAAIHAPKDSIVLISGGRAIVAELDLEDELDPASWIDVASIDIATTETLGELPPPPRIVADKPAVDLRGALARVPRPAPELDQIRAALQRMRDQEEQDRPPSHEPKRTTISWGAFARAMIERAASWFQRLTARTPSPARTPPKTTSLVARPAPPSASFVDRLRDRLHSLAARFLRITKLGHVVGRRQAEYIARMMEMFEKGELSDALRHAIPLNDLPDDGPAQPALSVPSPRRDLTISRNIVPARTSLAVGGNLFDDLRQMYRRAFERLEREGRYEEAAFVLAELLQSSEEAVMFLERHGFLQLAAELAESRNLAPGLIVRQYFIAGQTARALMIARRTGAFADAVLRLERTNPKDAERMRLLWADSLAQAGDYTAAVDALWPVHHARHLAKPWIERAIEAGGPAGARMLVRSVVLFPESFAAVRDRASALLEEEAYETLPARIALAGALIREDATPETRVIARPAVRAMMRDACRWAESLPRAEYDRLVTMSRDATLKADLPALPSKSGQIDLHHREHPKSFTVGRDDTGTLAISDIAVLPSGRILVALGEAGARLLTHDGRTVAHFDQPARHLVISDHGDRVITLIERGPVMHLTRIDLVRTKATPWCEMALAGWAKSFDGAMWFVATKSHYRETQELIALDVTGSKQEALWRLGDINVLAIERAQDMMSCLTLSTDSTLECWTHQLPSLTLRKRGTFPMSSKHEARFVMIEAVTATGLVALAGSAVPVDAQEEDHPWSESARTVELVGSRPFLAIGRTTHSDLSYPRDLPDSPMLAPALSEEWLVIPFQAGASCPVCVIDVRTGQCCARIELEGASRASVRMSETVIAIADDRGRIVILEHKHGRILQSLRI